MEIAGTIDHMVLFSGDGDFRSLVEAVQRKGVRVTVVSTISTQPPMVADELRRQADVFLDIVELQPKIGRDPAERAAREAREPRGPPHAAVPAAFFRRRSGRAPAPASMTTTISRTEASIRVKSEPARTAGAHHSGQSPSPPRCLMPPASPPRLPAMSAPRDIPHGLARP